MNNQDTAVSTFKAKTLIKSVYLLDGNEITLSLVALSQNGPEPCGYAISSENVDTSVICLSGCCYRHSKKIFDMLVNGQVSPHHLRDMLEDLTE